MSETPIIAAAIESLDALEVDTEREARRLLPMWGRYELLTDDDREAVYRHYRRGAK